MRLLKSRWLLIMLFSLVVQQLIVASSSLWFARLAQDVALKGDLTPNLLRYGLSLVLPYLPGFLVLVAMEAWNQDLLAQFIDRFLETHKERPSIWDRSDLRERRTVILAKDGPAILEGFTRYFYNLASSGMNLGFCLLVVSYLVGWQLLSAYGLGLVVGLMIVLLQAKHHRGLAKQSEDAKNSLGKTLFCAWENVVLANRWNLNLWSQAKIEAVSQLRMHTLRQARFCQSMAISVALAACTPTLTFLAFAILSPGPSAASRVAMISTLPRVFMIINSTYALLTSLTEFGAQRGRLDLVAEALSTPQKGVDLRGRMRIEDINVTTGRNALNAAHLFNMTAGETGRYTVTGPNGAGKSTLLLLLKNRLKESCLYLPARHQLCFRTDDGKASSGQQALKNLEEIVHEVDTPVVLLDEWDAHLDAAKRRYLSELLDVLARQKLVVEVRHFPGVEPGGNA